MWRECVIRCDDCIGHFACFSGLLNKRYVGAAINGNLRIAMTSHKQGSCNAVAFIAQRKKRKQAGT
jgi:hypothetical protein